MKNMKILLACWALCVIQVNAETLQFTGTFDTYNLVGVGVDITGVDTTLASWPANDNDLLTDGIQDLTFSVSGTIDVTGGVVTGAVINAGNIVKDYDAAGNNGRGHFWGVSWTYTGGNTLGFTPGSPAGVSGYCEPIGPGSTGGTACANEFAALKSGTGSAWDWQGIPAGFEVSDQFIVGTFDVDIGGASGHAGVAWTVNGNNISAQVSGGLFAIPPLSSWFNTAYQGQFSLLTVAAATAEDDGPIAVLAQVLKPIDVLANDTGFNDPVTVTIDAPGPAEGTALVLGSPGAQADVRISYTANAGAAGSDSFTYTVDDGGSSDTATVTLTVSPPGTAGDDFATTTRNTPVDIYVGSNDVGFDDTVTVTVDNGSFTAGGSAAVTAGQGGPASGIVVLYTPSAAAGSPGYSEEFTYTIDDGVIIPVVATVTVTVDNTVPLAIEGSITSITTVGVDPSSRTGTFETPGSGGSLGDGGIVTITVNPARGTATVADATITFNPASDYFEGVDSFTYTITDADGEEASAEVSIVIANGSPGLPDSRIRTAEGAASVPLNPGILAGNGSLAQHGFAVTTQASNGTCAINPANWGRSVVYTPSGNFSGTDSCGLTVTDGDGESAMATVTITVDQLINNGYSSGSSAANPLFLSLLAGVAILYRRRQGAFRCRPDSQW